MVLYNEMFYKLCELQQQIMYETGIGDIDNEKELATALGLDSVSDTALLECGMPVCLQIVEYRRLCRMIRKKGIY